MIVLLISQWLLVGVLLQHPGDVAGQLTGPPPTCPDDTFTFNCTVTGDRNGQTTWRVGGSSSCILAHNAAAVSTCETVFTVTTGTGFGVMDATSFSSTLSGTASPTLDGTLIECFNGTASPSNMVGNGTLQILGTPSAPNISCVDLSPNGGGVVNVTVRWTLSGGDSGNSADFYLINITTNAPQTPFEEQLNTTNANITPTGFMAEYEYNITVRGVNCGSQEGNESEPLTIPPQVPIDPSTCNITLSYNQSSGRLLSINSTWDTVPNPMDPEPTCPGPSRNITQYQITFQTTENVNIDRCIDGRCSHTFEPPSNPPSSYDSVSVTAVNVVGVGAARNCTSQPINTTNNLLTGEVVDVSSPNNVMINCTFLPGFTGSSRCTVQYGTDPTYMNLPYSAESTETGTAGDAVSVVLREQLNSSMAYYYNVSAVSGDITVVVLARPFRTNCNVTELGGTTQGGTVDSRCANRTFMNSLSISGGVICYDGTTLGSRAVYICSDNYTLRMMEGNEITRVCQSNGSWNGTIPQCRLVCNQPPLQPWHIALIVIGAIFLVVAIVTIIVNSIVASCMGNDCCGSKCCEDCCGSKCCEDEACCQTVCIVLLVIAAAFCVTGVVLWIPVGVVVSRPPGDNVCDPSWQRSRDGLIISAFVFSSLALIFAVVLVIVYWITKTCGRGGDETDGPPKGSEKTKRPLPEGSEDQKFELKEEQYDILQRGPKSPDPLMPTDQNYSQLGGDHSDAVGEEYQQLRHGRDPHAVPNPEDPNYSHLKEGASRPPVAALEYAVVGSGVRYPKEK